MSKTPIQLSDHFTCRKLICFTLPSITMIIFTAIYGVVDGFFVSNYAGKTPFAAVNLIIPVLLILGSVGFMFGTGGGALIAKTMGQGDRQRANNIFSLIVYASAACGVVLAALGFLILRPAAVLMGAEGELLEQALKNMREKKQYICYLYPYSIPYYRRKGWELISDKISYEIKDYQLPKNHQVAGSVRRVKADGEELKETYARFAEHTHGAILRDELAWNEYWLWDRDDIMAAIYYNENEEPDGYIIYWIENEVFYIKDMIFNHEEARTGLWNFVSAHFSMIDRVEGSTYTDEPLAFLLEDASIKESISPYYMARIVDFPAFVADYPFKADGTEREWRFSMTDPIMECNQGSFLLKISKDGRGTAVKISEPCADSISIQTMTTMLMGYKRPDYLAKIGRIHAGGETIDMLEDAIEQQPPYISDYF